MGILGTLFGGSKSSSTGDNKSYDFLKDSARGVVGGGVNFINMLKDELSGGFEGYKKKSGFNAELGEGLRGITGGRAAMGALRSGDTGKAYLKYGDDLASRRYENYLNQMKGGGDQSLNAAGILANAGQTSTRKDKSSNGALTSLFSDRRLKQDIERIGVADNGLPIYRYTYKRDPHGVVHIGFMADEVEALHPDAVTEDLTGIKMVDYGKAVM